MQLSKKLLIKRLNGYHQAANMHIELYLHSPFLTPHAYITVKVADIVWRRVHLTYRVRRKENKTIAFQSDTSNFACSRLLKN